MAPKSILASRTLWFNVIGTVLDVLAFTQAAPEVIPKAWVPYISTAMGIGNIILRRLSSGPVTWTTPPASPTPLTNAELDEILDRAPEGSEEARQRQRAVFAVVDGQPIRIGDTIRYRHGEGITAVPPDRDGKPPGVVDYTGD